tara:strand:+ start:498 stop:998 length:501 start_codon:yes stop_codon:yes gene_type:complete
MKEIIYLSGPMKGYPESNYPLFHKEAKRLRDEGHRVYNPAEFPHNGPQDTFPLRAAFAAYSNFICLEASAIYLLAGWEKSTGVKAELALAENCGLLVVEIGEEKIKSKGSWGVQEYKIWKGINPHKPCWAGLGFACSSWDDANDLLEYMHGNKPEDILRVVSNPIH